MAAKIVDITEKLSFEENPKIKIKNIICEVNSDAPTMLKLLQHVGNGNNVTPNDLAKMYELIFQEDDRKKIDKLKLPIKDFNILVESAMALVMGESESGE